MGTNRTYKAPPSHVIITMRDEMKHIKWRLINQDGLSTGQADKRIEELENWNKKMKEQNKK